MIIDIVMKILLKSIIGLAKLIIAYFIAIHHITIIIANIVIVVITLFM